MLKRGGSDEKKKGAAHAGKRRRAIIEKTRGDNGSSKTAAELRSGLVWSGVAEPIDSFGRFSNRSRPGEAAQKRDSVS
jgi:hypothetical protein